MERLQFVGLTDLDTADATAVLNVTHRHMEKFDRIVDDARLKIVIKQYHKEGRTKYSVDVHVTIINDGFSVDGHGWDVPTVVSDVLDKVDIIIRKNAG